ncbi:unnamed protein product [Urochloa humidicola]
MSEELDPFVPTEVFLILTGTDDEMFEVEFMEEKQQTVLLGVAIRKCRFLVALFKVQIMVVMLLFIISSGKNDDKKLVDWGSAGSSRGTSYITELTSINSHINVY